MSGVQVYEGGGVDPDPGLGAWRMWRGKLGPLGEAEETELCGYIPEPDLHKGIPFPPDRYRDCDDLYLTRPSIGSVFNWDRGNDEWLEVT